MRLNLFLSAKLGPEQKLLCEDMWRGIQANFKGLVAIDGNGTLLGPWNGLQDMPVGVAVLSTSMLPRADPRGRRPLPFGL
jgi:hypothetical protein